MGGLALKHLNVRRVDKLEYDVLSNEMISKFHKLTNVTPVKILAYTNKADFGDCDMLVNTTRLSDVPMWREDLAKEIGSKGYVCNGGVTSMEYKGLQFDFIGTPEDRLAASFVYFAYNDLGNLMGRIAHKMGFKYGHLGLQLPVRDGDHIARIIDIPVSRYEMFSFLGYSYDRWMNGFDDLEDIFKYVAQSHYFNKDIFLLHNRNAVSRIRDAKRKTYMEFLKWCEEDHPEINPIGYLWSTDPDEKTKEKAYQLQRAIELWPGLGVEVEAVHAEIKLRKERAKVFNGNLVMEWTGLSGKGLGIFMTKIGVELQTVEPYNADTVKEFVMAKFKEHQNGSNYPSP